MGRKRYSKVHWARVESPEVALEKYLRVHSSPFNLVMSQLVFRVLGDVKGLRVLDYGCGGGFVSVWAAKHGALVTGVDIEPTALATAQYYADLENQGDLCEFLTVEEFSRELSERAFDLVVAKDIVEHVEDEASLLAMLSACTRVDGRVVFTTHNKWSLNYLLEGTYQRYRKGNKNWLGWDQTHVRWYTPVDLMRKAKAVGLHPRQLHSVYLIPYKLGFYLTLGYGFRNSFWYWLRHLDKWFGSWFPFKYLGYNFVLETMRYDHAC